MNDLHWAVIVGINRYPGISDLHGPRNDAADFVSWLVDADGGDVPADHVVEVRASDDAAPLQDPFEALPTQQDVNRALAKVNAEVKGAAPGPVEWQKTRLYVFMAGHGIAPQGGKAALLMADASKDTLGANVELSRYADWYESCSVFSEVVFFADCCRNRMGQAPSYGPPFTSCTMTPADVVAVLGFASSLGDPAFEEREHEAPPDGRRGYFTRALIAGLRGGARDPATGEVTSTSLATYVRTAVQEATKDRTPRQDATMIADPSRPVVFRAAAAGGAAVRPTRRVRIEPPEGWQGGPVDILGPEGQPVERWDPATGPFDRPLPEGFYGVVLAGTRDAATFAGGGMFAVIGGDVDVRL